MSIEVMNQVWKHSQASGRQKLVLLAIADHQGEIGAWPSIATISKMVNASERSVQRDIQDLVQMGELTVDHQSAPSRGQYKSNLYWVTVGEYAGVTEYKSGVTDSDVRGDRNDVRGDTVGVLNITKPNRTITKYAQPEVERAFNEFWMVYPRKVGKQAAKRAFSKALKVASVDEIHAGVIRLANDPNKPALQYLKHPSTWLASGGWDDEPFPARVLNFAEKKEQSDKDYLVKQARLKAIQDQEKRERDEQDRKTAEDLKRNPPKECEHGRIVYVCPKCRFN